MLRGPQTAAELRTRGERIYPFASVTDVEAALTALAERELVRRLPRRPGEREERWTQLLGEDAEGVTTEPRPAAASPLEERLASLELRVAALEARSPDAG
jgi:uncharacterized protein